MLNTFEKSTKAQKRKEARQRQMRLMEEAASGKVARATPTVEAPPAFSDLPDIFQIGGDEETPGEDVDEEDYDDRRPDGGRGDYEDFLSSEAPVAGNLDLLSGDSTPSENDGSSRNSRSFMDRKQREKEDAESRNLILMASRRINESSSAGASAGRGGEYSRRGNADGGGEGYRDDEDATFYSDGDIRSAGFGRTGESKRKKVRLNCAERCIVYRRCAFVASFLAVLLVVVLAVTLPNIGDRENQRTNITDPAEIEAEAAVKVEAEAAAQVEDEAAAQVEAEAAAQVEAEAAAEVEAETAYTFTFTHLKDRLLEREISHASTLEDLESPQYAALDWLARSDTRILANTNGIADVLHLNEEDMSGPEVDAEWSLFQRYALAVLWFGSTDPTILEKVERPGGIRYEHDRKNNETHYEQEFTADDLKWKSGVNWMSGKGLCAWEGVTCHPQEGHDEKDVDFHVAKLSLTANNVHGVLPREMFTALHRLKALDLSENQLEGTLSDEIGTLEELEDLYLSSNRLSGNMPSDIVNCKKLFNLYLNDNRFGGPIPENIGECTKLRDISLFDNFFAGPIPDSIGNLKELLAMYLDTNDLSGQIPESMGELKALVDVRLRKNAFNGTIPTEFGEMTYLTVLYLDTNNITGHIPSELSKLQHLDELHLYQNDLDGPLPSELGLMNNLVYLYIDSNELTGQIPDEWGGMSDLKELFIFSNELTGPIPINIQGMEDLEQLRANDNQLTGIIPTDIGVMYKLEWIYFEENKIKGEVPKEIGELTNLKELHLHGNNISGDMPQEVCNLKDSFFLTELTADCEGDDAQIVCDCCVCS